MFADSTTNTAMCRCSLLFCFFSSSVQIPLDGCPEIHMHRPSHLRMKPRPLKTTRPTAEPTVTEDRTKKRKKKYTTQRLTYGNFSHPST